MAVKKFDWSYETLGDAVGCVRETVETLNDILKKSEPLNSADPRAEEVRNEMQEQIQQLLKLRDDMSQTRARFYRDFRPGAQPATAVADMAVAPFRNPTVTTL